MTLDEYIAAVKQCPRVVWRDSAWNPATRTMGASRREEGYSVGRRRGGKVAIVPVSALADRLAMIRLAARSTPRRLAGLVVGSGDALMAAD